MHRRRRVEVVGLVVVAAVALVTALTVPASELGAWSAGVLGPLVVLGSVACTLSWPWRRGEIADDEPRDPTAPPWRLIYLAPLVALIIAAPSLATQRPYGFGPGFAVPLVGFLAYLALLLGAVVFLVVVLPLGLLLGALLARREGRTVSPLVPLGAVLLLAVAAFGAAGSLALDGLPDDLAVPYLVARVLGLHPPGVSVAHRAWLLVARISGLAVVAAAVGLGLAGKRLGRVRRGA